MKGGKISSKKELKNIEMALKTLKVLMLINITLGLGLIFAWSIEFILNHTVIIKNILGA